MSSTQALWGAGWGDLSEPTRVPGSQVPERRRSQLTH